jgi:DNA-binding winged helix-turn-helix (wHTH) protein
MRFRFGGCELDTETRELLRGGKRVHLSPKGLQFLELLLENRPRALSKADIHERLWPGTFVTDGTLTSVLAEVRAAIEDDAQEGKFVRTVHRFGYAFSGTAVEKKAASNRAGRTGSVPRYAFRLFCGPREIALEEGESILGRDPDATVFIDHVSASRRHAQITIAGGTATIEDLGSKNGTRVDGERIETAASLADGSQIRIGSVRMDFRIFTLSGSTETAKSRG